MIKSISKTFLPITFFSLFGCANHSIELPNIPKGSAPQAAAALLADQPLVVQNVSDSLLVYQVKNNKAYSWNKSLSQQYVDYCVNEGLLVTHLTGAKGAYIRCFEKNQDFSFIVTEQHYRAQLSLLMPKGKEDSDYLRAIHQHAKRINGETPLTRKEIELLQYIDEFERGRQEVLAQKRQASIAQQIVQHAVVGTYMCLERDGYLYRGSVEQIAGQKYKIYVADAYFYGSQVSKKPEFIWINPTDVGWYICD